VSVIPTTAVYIYDVSRNLKSQKSSTKSKVVIINTVLTTNLLQHQKDRVENLPP